MPPPPAGSALRGAGAASASSSRGDKDTAESWALFIRELAKALDMRNVTTCTAQIFFHRYLAKHAFRGHDRQHAYVVSMACVFLAGKVEGWCFFFLSNWRGGRARVRGKFADARVATTHQKTTCNL